MIDFSSNGIGQLADFLWNLNDFVLIGLLRTSFAAGLFAVFVAALSPWLRKRYGANWLCAVWAILSVRLVIPLHIPVTLAAPPLSPGFLKDNLPQSTLRIGAYVLPSLDHSEGPFGLGKIVNWIFLASLIWIVGFTVFVLFHCVKAYRLKKTLRRTSSPLRDEQALRIFEQAVGQTEVRRPVEVRVCASLRSPMVYGLMHPVLLLPDAERTQQQLFLIFRHELVHIRRKHLWLKLLLAAACAIHWFNPLVYLMAARAQRDIELACDAEVVRGADTQLRVRYSETILAAAKTDGPSPPSPFTRMGGAKKTLKQRFRFIFDCSRKRKGIIALCVVAALSITTCFMVEWNFGALPQASPNTAASGMTQEGLQRLLACRTPYVGNSVKVVQAVDCLPVPQGTERGTVSLQTVQPPFGFAVNYTAQQEVDQQALARIERVFRTNAYLLLSVIDNADVVAFTLYAPNRSETFSYAREEANRAFGADIREWANQGDLRPLLQ